MPSFRMKGFRALVRAPAAVGVIWRTDSRVCLTMGIVRFLPSRGLWDVSPS